MKILVTGAYGFIGKNLIAHLKKIPTIEIIYFSKSDTIIDLQSKISQADAVFHLAGVNRPIADDEYITGNYHLTKILCQLVEQENRLIPVIFTSSIQSSLDNPYGNSKWQAEQSLLDLHKKTGTPVYIFKLPNVFGKWSKPNYNSVVSTFCYNIAHDIPITINDRNKSITIVHIDDVIAQFQKVLIEAPSQQIFDTINPVYSITIGQLAEKITQFKKSRISLNVGSVGVGLDRALYSTYLTFLPETDFQYTIPSHKDPRGIFVEMLKTPESGQVSFFTAPPGITRGEHFHHTKSEKFLVVKGRAKFRFRHIIDLRYFEIITTCSIPTIVETIPGWSHDITNMGADEMIVMLWANEIFNPEYPDTYYTPIGTEL